MTVSSSSLARISELFDAFELDVHEPDGSWTPIALVNPGFEDESEEMLGWYAKHRGQGRFPKDPRTLSKGELMQWFE